MDQANELYVKYGRWIMKDGFLVKPRGSLSREIIGSTMFFDLNEPLVVTLASRNLQPDYVNAELKWYMSGSRKAADISWAAPFWDSLKDERGEVVSNYGYWLFYHLEDFVNKLNGNPISRFDNCVNILCLDPDSRKAIINIHGVDNSKLNEKDTPCTECLQFFIRDNKLHMIVNMRSNDLVLGWCNDILQFQFIAWMMYAVLKHRYGFKNLELGTYFHSAGSLHIYEKHFKKPEFSDQTETVVSAKLLAYKFGLSELLNQISGYLPDGGMNTENLEWIIKHVAQPIANCKNSSADNLAESNRLVEFGAFPVDEGV